MKFPSDDEHVGGIKLTPMIDCMFLLLIFFLVTTSFYKIERELRVDLPESSEGESRESEKLPNEIIVNVLLDGTLFVNRQEMTHDELLQLLRKAKLQFPGIPVVIRGDGMTRHKHVVRIMEACSKTGITNVSIAVIPDQDGP
jgi:biopolymer transport protein ExbD